MKLLLVIPAQLQQGGVPRKSKKVFIIPLSMYLIAGMTPKEWEIEIVNDYTDEVDYGKPYDLVGITASTLHSRRGFDIAREFRQRGVKVVMGGFHPTLFTEEAQQYCDAVVVGEAELVWKRLLDDVQNDSLQPVYQADRFCDLVNQPIPRYDLITRSKFINEVLPVEGSRGCPYNCDFCSVTQFYGNKYRHRPIEEVVRDIKATGTRFITLVDDNLAGKMSYSAELFEALIPLKIFFVAQVSLKLADDERLLALSARAGFRYAIIGIETLDASNLEAVSKKAVNRVEEYVAKTKLFKKHGIMVAANLMFGFDNDDASTFEKTRLFVEENHFVPNPYILTPYPGTRLFERMRDAGRLLHTDFWKYTSYQTVFRPARLTPEELDGLFLDFFKRVYSIRNIFRRFFHYLYLREPFGSFMTQVAMVVNSLAVRANVRKGILPFY